MNSTWLKVEVVEPCLHWCLAASLCLVQLLKPHRSSCSCCFLTSETCRCLLHPGHFKGWDLNFQSNHVESHHLFFLILYTAFLIFFSISMSEVCSHLCVFMREDIRVGPNASREKWDRNKCFFLLGLQFDIMQVTELGAAACPGDCKKGKWAGEMCCPGKGFKSLLKCYRIDWINISSTWVLVFAVSPYVKYVKSLAQECC